MPETSTDTASAARTVNLPARYTIRFAVPEDAGVIQAQREAMFTDMGEDIRKLADVHAVSLAWHRRALQSGDYHGLLVEYEGQVVAGAGLLWQDLPPNPDTGRDRRAYVMVTAQHEKSSLGRTPRKTPTRPSQTDSPCF